MSSPSESEAASRDRRVDVGTLRRWGLPEPGRTKQSRGDAVIVGASRRTPGAVILAFEAAMRVGAGRVAVLVPGSVEEQLGAHLPEAAVLALPDDPAAPLTGAAAEVVAGAGAVLVGPGFDDVPQTRATLDAVLACAPQRLVLDAYALAVLPGIARDRLPGELLLTPNEDELEILSRADLDRNDLSPAVVDVAARFEATVAAYGLVGTAPGDPTGGTASPLQVEGGGPGLATAGSGDVLAGAITGFLARGIPAARAAAWGLWAHARAGDRLTATHGLGFLARELATELAFAVREVEQG
ncbi:ADP-dependent NAD(P)H-hydrate dehydratase [Microbacterium telephonicum]|uniref:ADP-dependent (S)-NAD(P)H-hydrate dehydratase n=1 Tax=Microbacterium telephonicum TaxID=1714841 RepID=A0A498C0Z3_9MICO|nr:ADP/ATP-dependent (S)-NAD(P)H-hydrate dehydratase [Microbacterium telephonicum]RLK46760.1 hydroxyethylthiazole kinase-like uncharacterized protein yjeF [Microbacterium telephonicum]